MRFAGSNRFCCLNPKEKETLVLMAGDRSILVNDVEEGEISDSESVEEISEQDFVQEAGFSRPKADSRCWVKFPAAYAGSLANYAWVQGVQNKPLTAPFVRGHPRSEENAKRPDEIGTGGREDLKKLPAETVILDSGDEDEKEEGELEEGEIDGDMIVETLEGVVSEASEEVGAESAQSESAKLAENFELQKKIKSVEEAFQTAIENSEDKSFRLICSESRTSLDTLQQLVLDKYVKVADELVQKAFAVVHLVHTIFCSGTSEQQQLHENDLLRFLCHVKEKTRALFSQDQLEEVEAMIKSVVSNSCKTVGKDQTMKSTNKQDNSTSIIFTENMSTAFSSQKPVDYFHGGKSGGTSTEALGLEPVLTSPKVRREFGPLLNLHIDYDENSLPSPTRDGPPALPVLKPLNITEGVVSTNLGTSKAKQTEDDALHPYVTDAVKAVSSYQQKFGHTSFLMSNRLPSPTPSEECNDEDGDSNGEVSSHCSSSSNKTVSSTLPSQKMVVSSCPDIAGLNGQETAPSRRPGLVGPAVKASAKSRDPRLRLVNPGMGSASDSNKGVYADSSTNSMIGVLGTRKLTAIEDNTLNNNVVKKQRNGITDSSVPRDPRLLGGGGWLVDNNSGMQPVSRNQMSQTMDIDTQKPQTVDITSNNSMETGGNLILPNCTNPMPVASVAPSTVSLPSLLKDIAAVNPTMLLQLIQMEQQRLASSTQHNSAKLAPISCPPSSGMLPTPAYSGENISTMSTKLEQPREKPQNLAQTPPMNAESDWGKLRMKPRDPRRVLQNNMIQKTEGFEPDQFKRNGAAKTISTQGNGENVVVRGQTEQAATCLPSQSAILPDIGPQFTKTLKKVADIVSNPQLASTSQSVLSIASDSLAAQEVRDRTPENQNDHEHGARLTGEGKLSTEQQNPWGDVEKMFEGYDDQQKAVIQKERSRRIEEQKKMFAARKLCLVLDLDHTLLNSAKFVEVDPVHEEILRKKEELDREKPDRHLFRFGHMGMWTKLRPGIWNFLEKASKLYELHLYTMGNKLYATEMAKVLDPTGVLFAGRVNSRGDDGEPFDGDERVPKSKDLDGVLGMESGVVIIDDSVRVWPHNKHNLILVERYTYFPCSRRQFGLLGPSLLEIDHDERPEDGTLASSLAVIERIHQNFFSQPSLDEVDVRSILACEQRKILSGCRILFSRIFPVGEANPHLHPLWQTAEQFGAVCTTQIDDQVTHVVANSLGTDKVNWALSTGRFVVHPGWVEASALLYRRANERDFAVKQ